MNDIISPSSSLKLLKIGLSDNPNAKVEDAPECAGIPGLDGKLNVSSDGRKYYMAWFADPNNPFIASSPVVVMQSGNHGRNTWRMGDPEIIKDFVGKNIPGAIVSRQVEPYQITLSATGETRQVETYTTVVYGGQSISAAFAGAGHTIVSNNAEIIAKLQENAHADSGFTGGGQNGFH